MNVQSIYAIARDQAGTNSTKMPDATLLTYLNKINRALCADIRELNINYFWVELYADTVTGQWTYTLPVASGSRPVEKFTKVWVKYNATTNYVEARADDYRNLSNDPTQLATNTDTANPIYVIEDTTFSIFPAPLQGTTNGLKIQGIKIVPDLTSSSPETDILIPTEYHDIYWMGMLPMIYRNMQLIDKAQEAQAEFEVERDKVLQRMIPRNLSYEDDELPDLSIYVY